MSFKILTPVEKRRLDRSITIVSDLSRRNTLSEIGRYIQRERIRIVLRILGADFENKVRIARCSEILKDRWPFKVLRLRKIINGQAIRL